MATKLRSRPREPDPTYEVYYVWRLTFMVSGSVNRVAQRVIVHVVARTAAAALDTGASIASTRGRSLGDYTREESMIVEPVRFRRVRRIDAFARELRRG